MSEPAAIVFDFDGVILQSVELKANAFRRLFSAFPDQQDRIVQLHLTNGGLSRYEKFRRIYGEYLHLPLSDEEMARLDAEFATIVAETIYTCPFVPGALEFIKRRAAEPPLFIASGTPETELREVVQSRGLSPYFTGVYGSPRSKAALLRVILQRVDARPENLVMIGDSIQDYAAAMETGIRFVGCVPEGKRAPSRRRKNLSSAICCTWTPNGRLVSSGCEFLTAAAAYSPNSVYGREYAASKSKVRRGTVRAQTAISYSPGLLPLVSQVNSSAPQS